MDGLLILKVVTIILGLAILIGGILYRKKITRDLAKGLHQGCTQVHFLLI